MVNIIHIKHQHVNNVIVGMLTYLMRLLAKNTAVPEYSLAEVVVK